MELLIVDDEPVIRMGLTKMAKSYSPAFKGIRTAENGLEALRLIRETEPDIVLTDIRMSKMDGLALCQSLYEEFPRIQTVVISGYSDFEYAQKCLSFGVKHYLLKPVTKSDIYEVLDKLIKKPARGYVSVSSYVEWIDRMELCVWALQTEELEKLIEQWRDTCLASNLTFGQLKDLLEGCLSQLTKRFQSRGYSPDSATNPLSVESSRFLMDEFEGRLRHLMTGLQATRSGLFKDPMEEARVFIDTHLSEEITLEQVAQMVGLTPTYFSALFKKVTGETFVQYRINRRMDKAKDMLSVPHVRIVDVAAMVGYEDYPHFTKTFKKIIGVSPSEFRTGLGIK